jgi:hypothetical protein
MPISIPRFLNSHNSWYHISGRVDNQFVEFSTKKSITMNNYHWGNHCNIYVKHFIDIDQVLYPATCVHCRN